MLLAMLPGLLSIALFVATLSSVPRGGTRRPARLK
jgi:hypothetical protein